MGYCLVVTTTDKKDIAKLIAKKLVQKKLAACVQINEVESFFEYEEEFENANEFRLSIKAKADNYSKIEHAIKEIHNYQLPQIIKLDITGGSKEFLNWIENA